MEKKIKIQTEINSLEKVLVKMEEKYKQFPSKSLYDIIISLELIIQNAKSI